MKKNLQPILTLLVCGLLAVLFLVPGMTGHFFEYVGNHLTLSLVFAMGAGAMWLYAHTDNWSLAFLMQLGAMSMIFKVDLRMVPYKELADFFWEVLK